MSTARVRKFLFSAFLSSWSSMHLHCLLGFNPRQPLAHRRVAGRINSAAFLRSSSQCGMVHGFFCCSALEKLTSVRCFARGICRLQRGRISIVTTANYYPTKLLCVESCVIVEVLHCSCVVILETCGASVDSSVGRWKPSITAPRT